MKVPPLNYSNGLKFPVLNECLKNLSITEERLCSPRCPFMVIKSFGVTKQNQLIGNVVNVPIDVPEMITQLPRAMTDTQTFLIKFKRMMAYKNAYMSEHIHPLKIQNAIKYLITTELYKKHDIKMSDEWLIDHKLNSDGTLNYIPNIKDINDEAENDDDEKFEKKNSDNISDEEWDERTVEEQHEHGNTDTMLDDFTNQGLTIAPGEGKRPRSMLYDEDATELSFPSIFGGQEYKVKNNLSFSKIARFQLRNKDRRAARSDYLFYSMKKAQISRISGAINLCLRKKTTGISASDILAGNVKVEDLIQHDEGYRFLKAERNSPVYWEDIKKRIMAMIRQFGIPTFFITLSAAETKWKPLLKALLTNKLKRNVSDAEVENLTFIEKVTLIKEDPVACARYFDYRVRQLFTLFKKNYIFQHHCIIDYYKRTEFQDRGSPHVHMLIWLKDAPKYDKNNQDSTKNCIEFIDKFISCSSSNEMVNPDFLKYQYHKHSFTCRKYSNESKENECRFSFPQFPMRETLILEPLENEEEINPEVINLEELSRIKLDGYLYKKKLKETYKMIKKEIIIRLKQKDNLNISYEEFLTSLNITHDYYIEVIRSKLKKAKIFLRRKLCDVKINNYNSKILNCHEANMDIQFVLDAYACLIYILNYINKTDRGMSKLLRDAVKEIARGNNSLKERFRIIANKFIYATEISAQEAVYYLLGMPVSECSRMCVFINTNLPEKRVHVVKSNDELASMQEDDTDILSVDNIEYYTNRPEELRKISLAEFLSEYNIESNKNSKTYKFENNDDKNEENFDISDEFQDTFDEESEEKIIAFKFNSKNPRVKNKIAIKRKQSKIIRFVHFDSNKDEDEYYRELIMLFLPWLDELREVIQIDHKNVYEQNKAKIEKNKKKFYFYSENYLENLNNEILEEKNADIDEKDPNKFDENENCEYGLLASEKHEFDIFETIGVDVHKSSLSEKFVIPNQMQDNELIDLLSTLNKKQTKYIVNIMHKFKQRKLPFYDFIAGQAGVGKSLLVRAVFQVLNRYFRTMDGTDPENPRILLTAPTGLAAFNIDGVTLHSGFALPINQGGSHFGELNSDTLNKYHSKFMNLKLIIIDEISMTSSLLLFQIHARLQQIFNSKELFGGISIIAVGDFWQLKPVCASYAFEHYKKEAYQKLCNPVLWGLFEMFELTEIMRQKDDLIFAQALNALGSGTLSEDQINLFKSCEKNESSKGVVNIFSTNEDRNEYNNKVIFENKNQEIISEAIDVCWGNATQDEKVYQINEFKKKPSQQTWGLESILKLKIGIRYMIIINIDTPDGIVNGATGKLEKITNNKNNLPDVMWIKFDQNRVGQIMKNKSDQLYSINKVDKTKNWIPIKRYEQSFSVGKLNPLTINRKQFAVTVSEGMTAHKVQGSTYENISVNVLSKMKCNDKKTGQVFYREVEMSRSSKYVSFSRATKKEGLSIIGK